MTLLQLLELAGEMAAAWSGRHPIWATLIIICAVVGSTVTVKKLELPVYRWARDWVSRRLDGLGERLNAGLARDVSGLTQTVERQSRLLEALEERIREQEKTADRRRADDYRREILRFNREIMEGAAPDRESYVEILAVIDRYNDYCREHPEYPNSRATAAIANIKRHYDYNLKVGFAPQEIKED